MITRFYSKCIRCFFIFVTLLLLPILIYSQVSPQSDAQSVQVRSYLLDNGLRVLMLERHNSPFIAAGWVVNVGSVNESPGITGIAHLFEHMMFKGTSKIGTTNYEQEKEFLNKQNHIFERIRALKYEADHRSGGLSEEQRQELAVLEKEMVDNQYQNSKFVKKNHFNEIYEQHGAFGLNAYTIYDHTAYFVTLPNNKLELFLHMESERLLDPVFREFYTEREVVKQERGMRVLSAPLGLANQGFNAMFWDAMPYAWPIIGWESDLNSITRQQAKDFFQYYSPHNITLILVGDFQHGSTVKMINKYFGRIPGSDKEIPFVVTKNEVGPFEKRMLVNLDKVSPQLRIRFHTVKSNVADIYPLLVLSEMLDSKVGLMGRKLVNGDNPIALKGSVYAYQWGLKYAGYFEMGATTDANNKLVSLENRMLDLLKDTKNATDDELSNAKSNVIMKTHRLLDSNEGYLKFLMSAVYAEGWQSINTYSDFINDVSMADIKRVVDAYLDPKLRSVLVVKKESSQ